MYFMRGGICIEMDIFLLYKEINGCTGIPDRWVSDQITVENNFRTILIGCTSSQYAHARVFPNIKLLICSKFHSLGKIF